MKIFSVLSKNFFSILLLTVINQSVVNAQSSSDLLPPDVRGEVRKGLSGILNGLVIFGSSSAIGSGAFTFEAEDSSPNTELKVLRLFNDINLTDSEKSVVPFINFGIGQAKLTEEIPAIEGGGANDFSTITTESIGIGAGLDLKVSDNWTITPSFDLVYSQSDNNYDYNNEFSQQILQLFDGNVFNWDVDTMSYNPGAKLKYQQEVGCGVTLMPSVQYTQIFVDSTSSSSDIIDVSTSSGVLSSKLRAEVDDVVSISQQELTLVPQLSRTDLFHDARADLGIKYFHEVSLGLLAKKQTAIPLFTDFGITAGYTFGEDMSGWRIGLDASL